jgi:hypothetical protein
LVPWLTANAPSILALAVLAGVGGTGRYWRAAVTLLAAGLVTTVAAYVFWPALYDIHRYVMWTARGVVVPTVAAIVARLISRLGKTDTRHETRDASRTRSLSGLVSRVSCPITIACVIVIALAGAYRFTHFPPPVPSPPAVLQFIAKSPVDTLVAAYPGDGDAVPLRTRRSLLVPPVALFPYHARLQRLAMERFLATRDAVYATDWAPVRRLRDEFGVHYLIVNRARYQADRYRLMLRGHVCLIHIAEAKYLDGLLDRGPDQPFVLRSPPADAVAVEDGDFVVLDLTRIK